MLDIVRAHMGAIYLITRFTGTTWGPSGPDRTQVRPMLAPWTLLSGIPTISMAIRYLKAVWPQPQEHWIVFLSHHLLIMYSYCTVFYELAKRYLKSAVLSWNIVPPYTGFVVAFIYISFWFVVVVAVNVNHLYYTTSPPKSIRCWLHLSTLAERRSHTSADHYLRVPCPEPMECPPL